MQKHFRDPGNSQELGLQATNSRTTLIQADELVGAKPAFDPKSVQFSNPGSELLGNTPVLPPTEVSASVCVHVCTYMYKYNTEPLI